MKKIIFKRVKLKHSTPKISLTAVSLDSGATFRYFRIHRYAKAYLEEQKNKNRKHS